MPRQKKALPDLRSMISGTAGTVSPDPAPERMFVADEAPPAPATQGTETANQDTARPQNQKTKKAQNMETKGGSVEVAPKADLPEQSNTPGSNEATTPAHDATEGAESMAVVLQPPIAVPTPRLPPVQVCVWIDPEVAGMIDSARGALATRLPKRPTRSRLVEAVLRKGLADVDALVESLWSAPAVNGSEED